MFPPKSDALNTPAILEQLGKAKAAIAELKGYLDAQADLSVFASISLKEAVDSSELEHMFIADDKLFAAAKLEEAHPLTGIQKEVLRAYNATWLAHRSETKFSIDLLKDIEGALLGKTAIVRGSGDVEVRIGDFSHIPPDEKEETLEELEFLCEYLTESNGTDPVLKAAIGYHQLLAIHPFRRELGRLGRILLQHTLVQSGLLPSPILLLSSRLNSSFKSLLNNWGDAYQGDWDQWCILLLKSTEQAANTTLATVKRIEGAMKSTQTQIESSTNIRRVNDLVRMIFQQPYSTVNDLTSTKTYAENTARNYMNRLTKEGILVKRRIGGHHFYLNLELYKILHQ